MNVLYLHTHFTTAGGGSRFAVSTANRLSSMESTEVAIVTQQFDHNLFDLIESVELVEYGGALPTSLKHWAFLPVYLYRLQQSLKKLDRAPDAIVSHTIPMPYWGRLISNTFPDSTHIWFAHDPNFYLNIPGAVNDVPFPLRTVIKSTIPLLKPLDRFVIPRSVDRIIANSNFTSEIISEAYGIEPLIVNPGVDRDKFCPQPNPQMAYLFTIGRLNKYKNFDNIMQALPYLHDFVDDPPPLVIGGTGDYKKKLETLASKLDIRDQVRFLGYVNEKELPTWYSNAICTVHASDKEPFGLVPIESMACGTPVVGINSGGSAESIKQPDTGRLVESTDPEAIASAIARVITERRERPDKFRESCREHSNQFSLETCTNKLRGILEGFTH